MHPGLVVSLAYLTATGIGMLSSWTFYTRFGINIFHYAQLSDFILSALRLPMATLAILLAIPAVWAIMRTDDALSARFGWYKYLYGPRWLRALSRTRGAMLCYFLLYGYAFSLVYAGRLATQVREGSTPEVEAQLQQGTYLGRDATMPFEARLLGTTSTYVFLYDLESGVATVVPLENLARMTMR